MSTPAPAIDIDAIIASVREAHATPMPPDMLAEISAFKAAHKAQVDELLAHVIAVIGCWLSEAAKRGSETAVEQIALQQSHMAMMLVAKGMKARRAQPLVPGRMALAAWYMAATANGIATEPLDLAGVDRLLADLRTPIEMERDRLRELVEEIADLGLGDVEMEHREIIARCRTEAKRWEDE